MNASTHFDPYSVHYSGSARWRDWACWVPGRVHEDLRYETLSQTAPVSAESTVPAVLTVSGADKAAQALGV